MLTTNPVELTSNTQRELAVNMSPRPPFEGRSLGCVREFIIRYDKWPKRQFQNFLDVKLVKLDLTKEILITKYLHNYQMKA